MGGGVSLGIGMARTLTSVSSPEVEPASASSCPAPVRPIPFRPSAPSHSLVVRFPSSLPPPPGPPSRDGWSRWLWPWRWWSPPPSFSLARRTRASSRSASSRAFLSRALGEGKACRSAICRSRRLGLRAARRVVRWAWTAALPVLPGSGHVSAWGLVGEEGRVKGADLFWALFASQVSAGRRQDWGCGLWISPLCVLEGRGRSGDCGRRVNCGVERADGFVFRVMSKGFYWTWWKIMAGWHLRLAPHGSFDVWHGLCFQSK